MDSSSRRSRSVPDRLLMIVLMLAVVLAVVGLITLGVAGPGSRWGWWHFGRGFQLLRWGAIGGIAAAAVGLLGVVLALALRRWRWAGVGALALLVGLGTVGVPYTMLQRARAAAAIHDITTDFQDPPQFRAVLEHRTGALNPPEYDGPVVAALQQRAYPDIGPAIFQEDEPAVFDAVQAVAKRMGWQVVVAVPEHRRLEATVTSTWFGFKDDVVVRLRPDPLGTRVDVRSKSRVGRSDLGANARRVRAFLKALTDGGLHRVSTGN